MVFIVIAGDVLTAERVLYSLRQWNYKFEIITQSNVWTGLVNDQNNTVRKPKSD